MVNRWLIYTSFMLAPAQFVSGIGSNCPSNVGFLAYNLYTQISWYGAIKDKELHALSLLPVNFNFFFAFGYLGGVTSGNIFMGLPLGLVTAGVMVLNTVAAWTSWATNMPEGFDVYQFFFFGWRTLTPGWHTFFLLWQIGDSMTALGCAITAIIVSVTMATEKIESPEEPSWTRNSWILRLYDWANAKYLAIPVGAALMLLIGWSLILWTELIVSRNQIESDIDMVAVWLFVAQVATMLVPSLEMQRRPIQRAESGTELGKVGSATPKTDKKRSFLGRLRN